MKKEIYFAGGCFWGLEKFFGLIEGVLETEVGYANGKTENPSYEDVCYKSTGHAETVKVIYDDTVITLQRLLSKFMLAINPFSLNRQGFDVGAQYRTGIYTSDSKELTLVKEFMDNEQKKTLDKIVVECLLLENYYSAEKYHQKYLVKNPSGYCHIPQHIYELAKKE